VTHVMVADVTGHAIMAQIVDSPDLTDKSKPVRLLSVLLCKGISMPDGIHRVRCCVPT
jgi:hypothetical protein